MSGVYTATEKQTWTIDAAHTLVEFAVKHMMITTVKGRFGKVEGVATRGEDESESWSVEVNIDAASIDTRANQRDEHLRSPDFLDVVHHPRLTFRGTEVRGTLDSPGDRFSLMGELTIRGVSREVELEATFEGSGRDPWGGERLSFSATTKIDRRDYGLTWNQALETGGVLVANEVTINLEVQLVKLGE